MLASAAKSMPAPGVTRHAREHVRRAGPGRSLAARRRPARWCRRPAGSCAPTDALEDDVGRLAQDLRAEDGEGDADDRQTRTTATRAALRPQPRQEPPRTSPRKSLDFWRQADAHAHHARAAPPGPASRARGRSAGPRGRRRRRGAAGRGRAACRVARSCRPPPRSDSCEYDDLAIGLVGREQLRVGADADDPPGVEDDDPVGAHDRADALGDDDHGASPSSARARRAGAHRWRSRARRSCRRRRRSGRASDQRAGDREPLTLAAGHVRAALA